MAFLARIAAVSVLPAIVTAAAQSDASKVGNTTIVGPYWKVIELSGKPLLAQDVKREAHLIFQPGNRVSGSDGCNQITGTYELQGNAIAFGQLAGTQMACINIGETDQAFRASLKSATRITAKADRLELFDATGKRLAAFAARSQSPASSAVLSGTAWQLVKFQGGDGATLTPVERAKYTIEFEAGGQFKALIDCNRGRGMWKSGGPNQLQFGPLTLTRAKCPPGSLHDHIVKQWGNIRSFVVKNGHLFLSLSADGGIYEFEPRPKT